MSHVPPPPPSSGGPTPGEHGAPKSPGQPAWGEQPAPQDPQQTQQWGHPAQGQGQQWHQQSQLGQQGTPGQQPGQPQPGQTQQWSGGQWSGGQAQQPGGWGQPGQPQAQPWGQQASQGYGQQPGTPAQHPQTQQGQQWGPPGNPGEQGQQWGQQPGQQGPPAQYWQQPGQQGQQGPQWGAPAPAKKGSRGLLVGILAAVVVVALLAIAYFVFFAGSDPEALEPDVSSSTQASVGQLVVGNCLEDISGSGSVGDVSVVPCADDHTSQVIGSTTFTDGDFPGQPTLVAQTTAACTPDLVTSGDVPADDLTLVVWTPSEASWSGGDRVGLCIATVDGSTTGSLIG